MKPLRVMWVCLLLGTGLAWASDVWDQETGSWSRKDADRILNNSPWGRKVATKLEMVKDTNKQAAQGEGENVTQYDRGDPREGDYAMVWWWSARTPRRAFMRIYELSGGKVGKEQADQFMETKATAHLVSIMGGGAMVAVSGKLSPEELKKAAWLQSPRLDKKIEPEEVEVVMAGGKPDRILFKFPREVDGQPLITGEDKRILFRWKLPKSPKEKQEDAKQFEVAFEPKKMVARGEIDY